MTSTVPSVTLVIVAYGHAASLPATLAALDQLDYPQHLRDIIVVENGEGDSAAIARRHPQVRLFEPDHNLGFAGGCNYAAANSASDVIVLINPDTEPQPPFLRQLVAPLADSNVGAVGAKLLLPDGKTIQHAGGFLTEPLAFAQHYGYGEFDAGQWDTLRDVEFATGAALALRRSTWEQLEGLDDQFFPGYYEEVDLCWRLGRHGMVIRYQPGAVAIHQEAAALGKRSVAYHYFYHRNRLRLLFKHRDNNWLLQSWLAAELSYLQTTADDSEIAGLKQAYLYWQTTFVNGTELPDIDFPTIDQAQSPLSELRWTLSQVVAKRVVSPDPFRSRLPFVGYVQTWFNRIATEAYLRPLIQQQNDFNASVVELGTALARQRRATDAAILCQGMMLAKFQHQA